MFRLKRQGVIKGILLSLVLSLVVSCSSQGSKTDSRFGEENYSGLMSALVFGEVPDVGDAVLYREVENLETAIARSEEVIVLVIYQTGQEAMHRVQPWMEQVAADKAGEVIPILASSSSTDPFLTSFDQEGFPAIHVILDASIRLTVYGYSDENYTLVMNTIDELTKP